VDRANNQATGRSVDLDRATVSIDELKESGMEPCEEPEVYREELPDFSADSKTLRWLCSLAERKPSSVAVLLLSAVGRKSNREIASIMRVSSRRVEFLRVWLRRNVTPASKCCTRR